MIDCIPCLLRFCTLAALLELDNLRLGQFMFSRPIVAGPLLGLVAGNPAMGALMGLGVEILTLDDLPMGALVPVNGILATAGAVWGAAQGGSPGVAFAGGLVLGWGFRFAEIVLRAQFSRCNALLETNWRNGQAPDPGPSLMIATASHLAWSWLALLAGSTLVELAARGAKTWAAAEGVDVALTLLPVLGLAAFLHTLRPRT